MIVSSNGGGLLVHVATALMMTVVPLMAARADADPQKPSVPADRSWPMFGGSPGRNMVNAIEQEIPADWCVAPGKHKNVKWTAELGEGTIGSPVRST